MKKVFLLTIICLLSFNLSYAKNCLYKPVLGEPEQELLKNAKELGYDRQILCGVSNGFYSDWTSTCPNE